MRWLTRAFGWLLCLTGALAFIFSLQVTLFQCGILFIKGYFNPPVWFLSLGSTCLGFGIARFGMALSRD